MYPISLRIKDKRCVVIGGGSVAERKVSGLLAADARIVVISPELTERLLQWWEEGRIVVRKRRYQADDLTDAALVFAATDDEAVNEAVCREAERRGLWINDASNPERSTFHVPAVLKRGGLQIAVSTSGAGPMLASRIRDELAAEYGAEYESYIALLGELRKRIQQLDLHAFQRRKLIQHSIEEKERIMSQLRAHSDRRMDELVEEMIAELTNGSLTEVRRPEDSSSGTQNRQK